MNRRGYLKSIVGIGAAGVASFSLFKHFEPISADKLQELYFSKREILAELSELIIPETTTPGAKRVLAHEYVIRVMLKCNSPRQQKLFLSGIEDIEAYAKKHYDTDFLQCKPHEKNEVLDYFSRNAGFRNPFLNKVNNKIFGQPFFVKLRSLVVEGYCNSEMGATMGLAYDYIPVTYEACIPLKLNQKSWATK